MMNVAALSYTQFVLHDEVDLFPETEKLLHLFRAHTLEDTVKVFAKTVENLFTDSVSFFGEADQSAAPIVFVRETFHIILFFQGCGAYVKRRAKIL